MDSSEKFEEESLLTNECDDLVDIHYAIIQDDIQKLDELCSQGRKNLDGKFMDDLDPQHLNMTPLALAAALNKEELVKTLLKHGADVDATFANLKTTALMTSSFHGHAPVVKLLLDNGADVKKTDVQKSTALGYCFGGSRVAPVVTLLLQAGIDVNISNVLGMNAFLLVSGYGNERLLKMVLQAGAKVKDAVNNFGHTPIHLSILGKQSQVDSLTERGRYSTAHYGLNRRNMKTILMDWSDRNKSTLLNGCLLDHSFEQTGQLLEDLGAKVSSMFRRTDSEDLWSEEEVMKHKIDVAAKYRKEKLINTMTHKKAGLIDSILSCGGKLGNKHGKGTASQTSTMMESMPMNEPSPPLDLEKEHEVQVICENFALSLRTLLDAGCQVDESEYTFGLTALDIAILNGDTESIAMLLCAGADHNHLMKILSMTDLYRCFVAEKPDRKEFKDLLDYDPHMDLNMSFENANIPTRLSESENDDMLGDVGLTPLSVAAKAPDSSTFDIIKMLIKHGAKPNHVGKGGRTTLGEACRWGNVRMVEFLISQGADIEQSNPAFNDATPIGIAVIEKQPKIVEYLISKGAAVDKMLSNGRTCLIVAADLGDMAMVELLLKSNLNSNFSDNRGFDYQTAQQYQSSHKDIRKILEAISTKSSQLKEEEIRRIEAEKRIQTEIQQASYKEKTQSTISCTGYEDYKQSNDIYEEIGVDSITAPKVVVPKIRKKKKKVSESANSHYEVVGEQQIKSKAFKLSQEFPSQNEAEPIYSQVKKSKKSSANGAIGDAKSLAVATLETNAQQITETIATGVSKIVGQDKKQTVRGIAQPVVESAVEFARQMNKSQTEVPGDDSDDDDGQTSPIGRKPEAFPRGVPIPLNGEVFDDANSKITSIQKEIDLEKEIDKGIKSMNLKAQVVPAKRKKKIPEEKSGDSLGDAEPILNLSANPQPNAPISLDGVDGVIVKPKARRRRTKTSTGEDPAIEPIHVAEEKTEVIQNVVGSQTLEVSPGASVEIKVKKKKKVKTPSAGEEL